MTKLGIPTADPRWPLLFFAIALGVTVIGFWPSFFGVLREVSQTDMLHGWVGDELAHPHRGPSRPDRREAAAPSPRLGLPLRGARAAGRRDGVRRAAKPDAAQPRRRAAVPLHVQRLQHDAARRV